MYFPGEGGIGKSSSMGILALDWAQDAYEAVRQFDFTFLILLRNIDSNLPLEDIIIQQHGLLKNMNVSTVEMKSILNGGTGGNILIMLDGYDEYTAGVNNDIDNLILNGRDNCLVVVSSRSGDFLQQIRKCADEELKITGFSQENIAKCAKQYLASGEKCDDFLEQAANVGLHEVSEDGDDYYGMLHVPIILLMSCAVYNSKNSLPSNKTDLFDTIVDMSISRTTLKRIGKYAGEITNLKDLKVKLGKFAWQALNKETKQLLLSKVLVLHSTTFLYQVDWNTIKATIPGKLGISAASNGLLFHCHMHLL